MKKRTKIYIPKTKDEIIADQISRLRSSRFVSREIAFPGWKLDIGQKVLIGNLTDCFIVDLLDEGRIVVVEYTHLPTRDNANTCQCWQAFFWFDVYPLIGPDNPSFYGVEERFVFRNYYNRYSHSTISFLLDRANSEELRDNPDYQRDYVWTHEDKIRYIESCFNGRELGKFVFVKFPYPDCEYEVLDGKQRLNTLKEFSQGLWTYQDRYFWQYNNMDRHLFEDQPIQYVELDGNKLKRSELLKIFLEINTAGVPQTEEHLNKVWQLYQQALGDEK